LRVDEQPLFLVHDERIFAPAIPQRAARFDHFVGAVVAQLFRWQMPNAKIARLEIGRRRHDVPAGAAMRDMVERGQNPGQMIRMVKRRRERGAKPQMLRRPRHHRQHDHRVEIGKLAAIAQIGVEAAFIDVGEAQGIGEETAVKARRLEHPSQVLVARRLENAVKVGLGVAPGAGELRRRASLDVGQEVQLAVAHRRFLLGQGQSSRQWRRAARCRAPEPKQRPVRGVDRKLL
jgi:hypothetical protein